ncbi:hypothetical protein [Duganella sp. Dugasp56]|uniref:hypothetical protein n=1 Tax=Duganella sp. Dugasp56 TaxID=3243046 RepID=UPI0039AF9F52
MTKQNESNHAFFEVETLTSLAVADEIRACLATAGAHAALIRLGEVTDNNLLSLTQSQRLLDLIAGGYRLESLAQEFKAEWWQRDGWSGVLKRFGQKHLA